MTYTKLCSHHLRPRPCSALYAPRRAFPSKSYLCLPPRVWRGKQLPYGPLAVSCTSCTYSAAVTSSPRPNRVRLVARPFPGSRRKRSVDGDRTCQFGVCHPRFRSSFRRAPTRAKLVVLFHSFPPALGAPPLSLVSLTLQPPPSPTQLRNRSTLDFSLVADTAASLTTTLAHFRLSHHISQHQDGRRRGAQSLHSHA